MQMARCDNRQLLQEYGGAFLGRWKARHEGVRVVEAIIVVVLLPVRGHLAEELDETRQDGLLPPASAHLLTRLRAVAIDPVIVDRVTCADGKVRIKVLHMNERGIAERPVLAMIRISRRQRFDEELLICHAREHDEGGRHI
jgi:hypothetical protein